jgi:thiol-disulfide isomerase/thioredoxin
MSKAERHESKTKRKSSFHENIRNADKAFVLFYATWCPFSRMFLPIFEEHSKEYPKECLRVIADEEPGLCEEYAIEYYPTVIMFKKGKVFRRLDSEPGVGLNKKQFSELAGEE